jgi:preprotein translocase subunit SecA
VQTYFNLDLPVEEWAKEEGIAESEIKDRIANAANDTYAERVTRNGDEVMTYVEKQVLLQTLDHLWREHLVTLDHLRQVIGWRGLAQRDPLNEYKAEAFELFDGLIANLRQQVTGNLMRVEVRFDEPEGQRGDNLQFADAEMSAPAALGFASDAPVIPADQRDPNDASTWGKVGRNEACPCGSGKKFKHCHGQVA